MDYREINNDTYITGLADFSLAQTMECGQCFHFVKLSEDEYGIVTHGRFLHAKQTGDELCLFDTGEDDARHFWTDYFDLNRDYGAIKRELLADNKLTEAIETMWGVHILNQDFFETLISFIISQNKQIPHIKQIVAALSRRYGEKLAEVHVCGGFIEFYSFPTPAQMKNVTLEELYDCKTGFRAPYIYDAVSRMAGGEFDADVLKSLSADECNDALMQIKGVGPKVANCVSLFGLGHRESFPVDVWIKRIMESLYFDGKDTSVEKIRHFGETHFGALGGYAQQYLFYYARSVR